MYRIGSAPDLDARRYDDLKERAELNLRTNLGSGAWLATGRDPRQAANAPRFAVPRDRWPYLQFDCSASQAIPIEGSPIIEILVSTRGALELSMSSKRARLGAIDLELAPRSFVLLSMLANAAKTGRPLVLAQLKELYEKQVKNNDKAPSQGIKTLKDEMERSGVGRPVARSLIRNQPAQGYYLNLHPSEILIDE